MNLFHFNFNSLKKSNKNFTTVIILNLKIFFIFATAFGALVHPVSYWEARVSVPTGEKFNKVVQKGSLRFMGH